MRVPLCDLKSNLLNPYEFYPQQLHNYGYKLPQEIVDKQQWSVYEAHLDADLNELDFEFFNPIRAVVADPNDSASWMSFDSALNFLQKERGRIPDGYLGIAFLHLPTDDFRIFSFIDTMSFSLADDIRFGDYFDCLNSFQQWFLNKRQFFLKAAPLKYDYKDEIFEVIERGNFIPVVGPPCMSHGIEDRQVESLVVYNAVKGVNFYRIPKPSCTTRII
jgi:hypothetical protein